ncbi:putative short chain dehydrogenase/reductase family oxidoreductase [Aspergillus clavatus NRRL 1]|uniref:NAD-dependent 15-hydroxyprostaglandin dehydrogenase n=1 Tax=Aspergillus clavatus (strain ATCC 1007 / CBS 513.65 / DSM 816 / NCTC 3887 / NRRL 1 / QM 1276 / 107) TaxID=344612 RepID=A1CAD3_ASPCL|nr:NAD-dependent 15-hydroxyprostaglandin dehydrogenase [Aspergillus clavatus NRRL 1]EAW12701.1 NAD-dependent 15-hydroxyprostaglandin dehydrogenase [Aspergillus clavatus NRRL 1]
MAFSVKGKSAIVTGAGSGINLCFAKLLLENGCNVLIADLALRPEAQAVVERYSGQSNSSNRAVFQKTDVVDWRQLERMFEVAVKEFDEVDIVCPGAGIFEPHWTNFWRPPGTPDSRDPPDGGRYALLDINLTHPIRTTQLAISHFLRARGHKNPKHIIHISSIAGQNAFLASPIYVATKHAINGLVRSLAKLDGQYGIRVTAVAPGVIKTPLYTDNPEKMKMVDDKADEWVTPEEVAEVMLALIQQDKVSETIGDKTGQGPQCLVQGGTILEVSKTVRSVSAFNDPGPAGRPGNTISDMNKVEDEVYDLLSTEGWGESRVKL